MGPEEAPTLETRVWAAVTVLRKDAAMCDDAARARAFDVAPERVRSAMRALVRREVARARRGDAEFAMAFMIYGDARDPNSTYDKGWADCAYRIGEALRRRAESEGTG